MWSRDLIRLELNCFTELKCLLLTAESFSLKLKLMKESVRRDEEDDEVDDELHFEETRESREHKHCSV